jgi:nickel-dependent lactate racemase
MSSNERWSASASDPAGTFSTCSEMTKIQLGYGQGAVTVDCDESRFRVLKNDARNERPLSDQEIGNAIDSPIGSLPIEEILLPGARVLIVVSDATRATGSAQILNILVRRLIPLGIAPGDIRIIFATGIHRAVTAREKNELLTPFITQRLQMLDHDAFDQKNMAALGITERGIPVEVNRAVIEHTNVILTGGVGFHYFAGFTGGRKSICPGLASNQTVEATHMLAMDFEHGGRRSGVGMGRLDGNPIHEECSSAAQMVSPSFLINTVVDERGRAVRVYAGDWREAHTVACKEYKEEHSIEVDSKRSVVIASCGGAPYDINLIQAHKALDMAANACLDGGTIVLLAECGDGLGRPDFLKWFDSKDSLALEASLRDSYEVNGQTAWSLLTKTERFRVFLVSALPEDDVRRMRMVPARSVDEALDTIDSRAEGYVLPRGASLLPVVKSRG